MSNQLSFIPLGGIGDVTKNMYLYEYNNQILIVDCGLGFADETMLGVDLLLPDISYLLQSALAKGPKKIVGMLLTHGHEDHIGALPFILPQLPSFPIFASPLTAALANEKLQEFNTPRRVQKISFDSAMGNMIKLGVFKAFFINVTHSILDTAHIFIQTPVGNFYHGSDFKFDDTPSQGKKSDYEKIAQAGKSGILCLLSDCLGAERSGRSASEIGIKNSLVKEIEQCQGKFIVTTYSSHIARLNQIIQASEKVGRRVCFVGRSLIKTKEVASKLGYIKLSSHLEVTLDQIKQYPDHKLTLIVAGSQGQEESAMARIANNEHREVRITERDTVIFSADPIPGNEVLVYELIDTLVKKGARVVYTTLSRDFHVSGHGSQEELGQLISLVRPQFLLPIGGAFRQMAAYRNLAINLGYKKSDILLLEDGQEVIFSQDTVRVGRIISVKNVYVDEISGEEVESFVLRDRQKLSEGGIVIVLCEVDSASGQLTSGADIIIRGFTISNMKQLNIRLLKDIQAVLKGRKGRVTNWVHIRKLIGEVAERRIFKDLRRRPLVFPVVIEA
ncbi:MAG: ribonuclease J [Candidatus Levybacteria bacterium]|nr:ribonuclease J [Candidatus Levybacteria bacterium]